LRNCHTYKDKDFGRTWSRHFAKDARALAHILVKINAESRTIDTCSTSSTSSSSKRSSSVHANHIEPCFLVSGLTVAGSTPTLAMVIGNSEEP